MVPVSAARTTNPSTSVTNAEAIASASIQLGNSSRTSASCSTSREKATISVRLSRKTWRRPGNSSATIQDKYLTQPPDFSGFNAPDKGKATAAGMFDAGADVVYAAAGGSGAGVFVAAKAASAWAIGVDSDQYLSADAAVQSVILTSALKNVNVAVFDVISASVKGSPLSGVQVYDLKNNGVGYSKSNPAVQPFEAKADAAAQAIISGSVVVPN